MNTENTDRKFEFLKGDKRIFEKIQHHSRFSKKYGLFKTESLFR
jgi:hypothetical protein